METDARIKELAEKLNCISEHDFALLAGATQNTIEAWRKRGTGPDYIRLGRRYFYPIESLSKFMEGRIHKIKSASPKQLL